MLLIAPQTALKRLDLSGNKLAFVLSDGLMDELVNMEVGVNRPCECVYTAY